MISWNIEKGNVFAFKSFVTSLLARLHCSINYVNSPFCSVNIILKTQSFYQKYLQTLFYYVLPKKDHWRWIALSTEGRGDGRKDTWPSGARLANEMKRKTFLSTFFCTIKLTATQQKFLIWKYFIQRRKKVSAFFVAILCLEKVSALSPSNNLVKCFKHSRL